MIKGEQPTYNDGNGFFDSEGLCDTLILDCNNSVRALLSGNCVEFCSIIVQMVQKLANLKKGIKQDLASRDQKIKDLNRILDDMVEKQTGLPVDRGGDVSDGN